MRPRLILGVCATVAVGLSAALIAGTACRVDVPYYCCTTQQSCDVDNGGGVVTGCLPRYPDRPYCDDQGAFPASEGIGRTCIADPHPGLGTICITAADCTDATYSACIDQHCQGCSGAADCTAVEPVCSDAHACIGCTQEAECSSYSATPHCGASGTCVACRDGGDCTDPSAPACDSATASCRACRADAECGSEICDEGTGKCVPESEIVYVDGTNGSATPGCTKVAPCKTVTQGVAAVSGMRKLVKIRPGSYSESVTISDRSMKIVADGVSLKPGSTGEPGLNILGASTVAVEGLRVHSGGGVGGDGVRCTGGGGTPVLAMRRVSIEDNGGQGLVANDCVITLERSTVTGNDAGGISIIRSDFSITNNVIIRNGGPDSAFGGVSIFQKPPSGTAGAKFEFNTVVGNASQPTALAAGGVICASVTAPLSMGSSIVYGNTGTDKQVDGGNCSWTYSDIESATSTVPGAGNINATPMFVSEAASDYHIQPGSPCINAADPAATINVDIDGDSRPVGARSDMGADEVLQ